MSIREELAASLDPRTAEWAKKQLAEVGFKPFKPKENHEIQPLSMHTNGDV